MKDHPLPADVVIARSRILPFTLLLLCCLLIITTTIDFSFPLLVRKSKVLTDFDDFYIAGKMFWDGSLASAYSFRSMLEAQLQITETENFLPWTYPPQFSLITVMLARLPEGLAYFIFTALTFLSYILVLRSLAKEYFGVVILAIMPALFITIKCGQNGFLTGTFFGLFCLAFMRDRLRAGLPLGFMVIKPHLAIGMTLLVLVNKRWGILLMGALVVALTSLLATIVFGYHIWPAFMGGVRESTQFLKYGLYPFFRMTSIYAVCVTFGLPWGAALLIQGMVALAACWFIYYACSRGWSMKHTVGIAVLASLLVSPYNYDYDLPIFGIALALLMPDIIAGTSLREKAGLLGCSWVACGWGILQNCLHQKPEHAQHITALDIMAFAPHEKPYSVAGVFMLIIFFTVLKIVAAAEGSKECGSSFSQKQTG